MEMKRLLKIFGGVVLVALLGVAAVVGTVLFFEWHAERRMNAIVAELVPGTPFAMAVARLGQPVRTVTASEEKEVFERNGLYRSTADTPLHLFIFRGPALYWVLVHTDPDSQTVRHAEWQTM